MKRFISLLLFSLLLLGIVGCGNNSGVIQEPVANDAAETEEIKTEEEKLLDKIEVTYKVDSIQNEGKQRVIVYVENKSNKTFNGDIHVRFKDNNKQIGYDMIIVENLGAGQKSYANTYITPSQVVNMSYDFAKEYSFTDDGIGKTGYKDNELSDALTEYMFSSFGGNGKSEYATSWYKYITKLEIYKDESAYYAVAIVSTNDEMNINRISSVLTNFNNCKLSKIIIKDEAQNVLLEKALS